MLATTPNIGTPGYPLPKSSKVDCLVHVFHHPSGIDYYKKNSLDFYDAVCVVGDFAKPAIRFLEEKRNLPQKELFSAGLPLWDFLYEKAKNYKHQQHERKIILLAPSWGDKGFMSYYDANFIKDIAAEFDIIFRPHPQSRIAEPELLEKFRKVINSLPNAKWDDDIDPSNSLAISDALISDTSAIRLDYAVIYGKPVISLEVKPENLSSFEIGEIPQEMQAATNKLLLKISRDDVKNIRAFLNDALKSENVSKIRAFADENIANLGRAGESVADYVIMKAKGAKA